MVFVVDTKQRPLMPCSEKRARLLLERNRAVVHRLRPFTIRLRTRLLEQSALQPVALKLDPGAKTTGTAVVRRQDTPTGPIDHALHLAELAHRGEVARERMRKRAAYRRRRRSANLRYRAPRFDNRCRREGWLPPSLESRLCNVVTWARRYQALAPVAFVEIETVRFDTQALQNPEISGVEYQRGALFGYEVWEYLLQKWGRRCAYCGAQNVPLEKEHIVPRSRGGSNRVSNLAVACRACNEKKGNRTAAEFGHPAVQARAKAPLKDAAAVNITRYAIRERLQALGLPVHTWSGGRTKYNRERFGVPKAHALDALCVGDIASVTGQAAPILEIKARGRGQRCRTNVDAYGFPRGYRTRCKTVRGFRTGDLARAEVPKGKKAGTYVGTVTIRASGSFMIGSVDNICWRYCRLLQRADGYGYAINHLQPKAETCKEVHDDAHPRLPLPRSGDAASLPAR